MPGSSMICQYSRLGSQLPGPEHQVGPVLGISRSITVPMSATTPLNTVYDFSLLSTEFVPDGIQTGQLKSKILRQKQALTHMNAGLQDLQLRVRRLSDQINDAEEALKLYEAFLSPSRRLAPETLGQVFMHCLPMDAVVTITPILAPLLLTHVSRR